ncbi:MAG TPA: hypothetical protein EYG85_11940 [Crocinitomix sp.]|nr:hypothetical protein [Crocinitomix sp.]
MINNKNILLLLVTIFVYVNFFTPMMETNSNNLSKLQLYRAKLKVEKNFLENNISLEKYIGASQEILKQNGQFLYSAKTQKAIVFNQFQLRIKKEVKRLDGKVVNLIWGEPYSQDNLSYISMPFTIIVELHPNDVPKFLNTLFSVKEVIVIKQLHFVKKSKTSLLNMQIIFYKEKGKK